jgi:hypothetical protein
MTIGKLTLRGKYPARTFWDGNAVLGLVCTHDQNCQRVLTASSQLSVDQPDSSLGAAEYLHSALGLQYWSSWRTRPEMRRGRKRGWEHVDADLDGMRVEAERKISRKTSENVAFSYRVTAEQRSKDSKIVGRWTT